MERPDAIERAASASWLRPHERASVVLDRTRWAGGGSVVTDAWRIAAGAALRPAKHGHARGASQAAGKARRTAVINNAARGCGEARHCGVTSRADDALCLLSVPARSASSSTASSGTLLWLC